MWVSGNQAISGSTSSWITVAVTREMLIREDRWSEAIAVGSLSFVESVKGKLNSKVLHRELEHIDGAYALRDQSEAYDGSLGSKTERTKIPIQT